MLFVDSQSNRADLVLQIERLKNDGRQKDAGNAELRRQLLELAGEVSRLRTELYNRDQRAKQSLMVQYVPAREHDYLCICVTRNTVFVRASHPGTWLKNSSMC